MTNETDVMGLVQTRAGMKILGLNWMKTVLMSDWACTDEIAENLVNKGCLTVPLFAIMYYWDGDGRSFSLFRKLNLKSNLAMNSSSDFEQSSEIDNKDVEERIKAFTPTDMLDLLCQNAADPDSTPFHDSYYGGHGEDQKRDVISPLSQWLIEKSIKNKINTDELEVGRL